MSWVSTTEPDPLTLVPEPNPNPLSASSWAAKGAGELGIQQGAREPAMHQGVSKVFRKVALTQKASKELGSKQETRLLGSQQGIREPARHQKGSNESESQQ